MMQLQFNLSPEPAQKSILNETYAKRGYSLGVLCRRAHDHEGTHMSVRDTSGHCIECRLIERREREAIPGHKERQKLLRKQRINNDPQGHRERERKRHERQREIHRGTRRERQRTHKREQRAKHPEKIRQYQREYYSRRSVLIRLRNRLRRAFRDYGTKGKVASSDEYGIDYMAIIRHLGPCPGDSSEWHIDHIRPLASFDWDDLEQIRLAFSPENHQWLRAHDNLAKSSKYVR